MNNNHRGLPSSHPAISRWSSQTRDASGGSQDNSCHFCQNERELPIFTVISILVVLIAACWKCVTGFCQQGHTRRSRQANIVQLCHYVLCPTSTISTNIVQDPNLYQQQAQRHHFYQILSAPSHHGLPPPYSSQQNAVHMIEPTESYLK